MIECNRCDRKGCKLVSRNIFPKMKNKPTTKFDRADVSCPHHIPIETKVPMAAVVRGNV